MTLRKGDTVKVMRGKFKKKEGKVTSVSPGTFNVQVEGIQRKKQDGSKVSVKLQPSNLQIILLNLEDAKRIETLKKPSENTKQEVKTEKSKSKDTGVKMHLKRQEVPKSWLIYRKGTKYVVRPEFDAQRGVPFLIVLRDMLKIVQNRKEAKRAIHLRQVLMNNKQVSDEKNSVTLFDTVTILPSKKHYRMDLLDGGKFSLTEIKEGEANHKIVKLTNKKDAQR